MGEHFTARPKLLSAAVQHLPADKPRVVVGMVSDWTGMTDTAPAQQQQELSGPSKHAVNNTETQGFWCF